MISSPKVSVVIPVYNAAPFLDQCLNSLINQSIKNIEIICVDDGSEDQSLNILKKYQRRDDRIKVLAQNRLGAGAARNLGMSAASGEYFAFIDADDFVDCVYLEELLNNCRKYNADICICAADIYNNNRGIYQKAEWLLDITRIKKEPFNLDDLKSEIFQLTKFSPWAKLFNAQFIRDNNLQFQELTSANDLYFVLMSMCLARRISVSPKVLFHYRMGQTTNIQSNLDKSEDNFCKALVLCREALEKSNLYEQIKVGFSDLVYQHCQYNLSKLKSKPEAKKRLLKKIKDKYLERFKVEPNYLARLSDLIDKNELEFKQENLGGFDVSKACPIISVVIPVFNVEKYLEKCLDSVINQTLKNIEIICVNDGSEDGSGKILNKYTERDIRIKVINKDKNEGLLCARKDGVLASSGKYVMFVDSDDYLDETACEVAYRLIEEHKSDILQFTCGVVDFSNDKQASKWLENALKPKGLSLRGEEILDAFFVKRIEFTSLVGKLFKRDLLLKAYSELNFYNCYVGEDVYQFFYIAFFSNAYCGVQTKELYFYQRGLGVSNSSYVSLNKFKLYCEMGKICDNIRKFVKGYPENSSALEESVNGVSRRLLTDCLRIYSNRLSEVDKIQGMRLITKAWAENPVFGEVVEKELGQAEVDIRKEYLGANRFIHLSEMYEHNKSIPRVSVVIPIFNCDSSLERCLKSLLHQNEKLIQIICVDDGSTDRSLSLLREYLKRDKRISVISIDHHGESFAKNLGLKYTKGKYIWFLDATCEVGPGSIDRLCEFADDNKLDALSFGVNKFVYDKNKKDKFEDNLGFRVLSKNFSKARTGQRLFATLSANKEYTPDSALLLLRRDLIINQKIFFPNGILFGDEIFVFKCLLKASRAARLNEIHCVKKIGEKSVSLDKMFKVVYAYLKIYMEQITISNGIEFEDVNVENAVVTTIKNTANKMLTAFNHLSTTEAKKVASLTPLESFWFNQIKLGNENKTVLKINKPKIVNQNRGETPHLVITNKSLEGTKVNTKKNNISWAISKTIFCLKTYGFMYTLRKIRNYLRTRAK